jgi:hypothetical protein
MKKLTLFFFLLIIILLPLEGQKSKDALYLKNGSIINGKLIEMTDNQYKIQTNDGSLMIYPISDVEKYAKTTSSYLGRRNSGPGFSFEAGCLVGAQTTDYKAPFSFDFLGNFTIKTKNIISLGSGVEFIGVPFAPIFLEYKYLFTDKNASPFFFARCGQLFHLAREYNADYVYDPYGKTDYKGGVSLAIGTGVSWSKEDIEPYLSFAYRYAETSYKMKNYTNYTSTYFNSYNRLEIKFGFKF